MLKNIPNNIISYLVDELPPYTGLLMFKTDADSKIIDFHGPYSEYLNTLPEKGKEIYDYLPALHSMIPPLISPMVLNRIQVDNSRFADIHLIEESENEYWIILVDQSNEIESLRNILQKINENKFREESGQPDSNSGASLYLLEVFDYLGLEIDGDNGSVVGKIPDWFKLLKPNLISEDQINYKEEFPYLEVFVFEAEELWSKDENDKVKSGIWAETLPSGKDIALTAFAIKFNGDKFLLIRLLEESIDKEHLALQMARDQKLAYEKLEKAERKLKVLLDYKDKFVSIVSHDLRSPVAAVLGIAEMLVNDKQELSKLDGFYQEMIFSIKEEMLRLLDYNDKLYHWSNLELGNFKLVKTKSSLEKIINIAHRTADKKLKAKNISFSTNLKNDIEIEVDMTLFLQVINNLVANAIKFTPENGKISIDVMKSEQLQIAVIDSGVGMPKEVSENIFAGFARNSTIGTGGEKGTGLGLGIVKKIIDSHGFTIYVKSEEGKGSEFIISL